MYLILITSLIMLIFSMEMTVLVATFHLNEKITIRGFREFKDTKDSSKINYLLTSSFECSQNNIVVSSFECERSFSAMNNIITSGIIYSYICFINQTT